MHLALPLSYDGISSILVDLKFFDTRSRFDGGFVALVGNRPSLRSNLLKLRVSVTDSRILICFIDALFDLLKFKHQYRVIDNHP